MKCILIATLTVGKFVFYSISQDALSFSDVRSCCSSHHDSCLSLQIQYLWAFTSLLQRGLSVIVMCIFQYFNGKPQVSFSPSNIKRVINNGYKTVCCKKHSWHHLPKNVFSWVLLFWNLNQCLQLMLLWILWKTPKGCANECVSCQSVCDQSVGYEMCILQSILSRFSSLLFLIWSHLLCYLLQSLHLSSHVLLSYYVHSYYGSFFRN